MEAHDPLPPVRRQDAALFRPGTGDSRDLAEDVDPAAAPDGAGRDCAAGGASSGAAESRVWFDGVGTSAVPRARCAVALGGSARRHGVMVSSAVSGWGAGVQTETLPIFDPLTDFWSLDEAAVTAVVRLSGLRLIGLFSSSHFPA